MPPSLEASVRIAELREKARTDTLTTEELKEAIRFLRGERLAMAPASSKPRTKAAPVNPDDLLKELGI